jgi:large-conductance mechanosensitive channel
VYTEIIEEEPEPERSYWQQIGDGLKESAQSVARFFMDLLKWVIINLPVFAVLLVIAAVLFLIVKINLHRRKKKKAAATETADGQAE